MTDLIAMAEAYQRTAVLAATVRTGLADALFDGPASAQALATRCRAHPRGVRSLLGALGALGLVHRGADGYALSDAGAPLARAHPQTVAAIVEKEWFFYGAWAGLEHSVRDGHAQVEAWRKRLSDDPEQARDFLRALDDLAARFGGELAELARPLPAGRLLDVGGGAGSHAARLAAGGPVQATVLDLPEVEPVLRERHSDVSFLAGDLEQARFGRPPEETWDVVLLANILHDHPPDAAARIVEQAASLLAPDGMLLVYEWLLEDEPEAAPAVAMFDLMMLLENEGGAAYTAADLTGWLAAAGIGELEVRHGHGPIAVVRGRGG